MIKLTGNNLRFTFPQTHPDAVCEISFQRTLRIPDDGKDYPLPAGLGEFPLFDVNDYPVPRDWKNHGGVFLPMHQSEAMWLRFWSHSGYPFAIKLSAGKINAVTGETWNEPLSATSQDYLVIPEQPWLDGFCIEKGVVRQSVATALGDGYTVEEQLTGQAEWGGLQFVVYPLKAEEYRLRIELPRQVNAELEAMNEDLLESTRALDKPFKQIQQLLETQATRLGAIREVVERYKSRPGWEDIANTLASHEATGREILQLKDHWEKAFYPWRRGCDQDDRLMLHFSNRMAASEAMGMAAGGRIKQEVAQDPYGLDVWDSGHSGRCFVHLLGAETFTMITGKRPPNPPVTPEQYAAARIPWFDYYLDGPAVEGSEKLATVKPLAASMQMNGQVLTHNDPTIVPGTINISHKKPKQLVEGTF